MPCPRNLRVLMYLFALSLYPHACLLLASCGGSFIVCVYYVCVRIAALSRTLRDVRYSTNHVYAESARYVLYNVSGDDTTDTFEAQQISLHVQSAVRYLGRQHNHLPSLVAIMDKAPAAAGGGWLVATFAILLKAIITSSFVTLFISPHLFGFHKHVLPSNIRSLERQEEGYEAIGFPQKCPGSTCGRETQLGRRLPRSRSLWRKSFAYHTHHLAQFVCLYFVCKCLYVKHWICAVGRNFGLPRWVHEYRNGAN